MPKSYRPMVVVNGEVAGNGLRFRTYEEARANAAALMSRWFSVDSIEVHESEDEPNQESK